MDLSKVDKAGRKIVVDAGAAIRVERIEKFGGQFYTTAEVLKEIRDVQARKHLLTLPFELKVRNPTKEDFDYVKSFASHTGDLGFLSTNDMGLLALAVRLAKEEKAAGTGAMIELRKKPELGEVSKKSVPFEWQPKMLDTIGEDFVSKQMDALNAEHEDLSPEDQEAFKALLAERRPVANDEGDEGVDLPTLLSEKCTVSEAKTPNAKSSSSSSTAALAQSPETETEDEKPQALAKTAVADKVVQSGKFLTPGFGDSIAIDLDEADDDEDGGGWVTVDNIRRLNNAVGGDVEDDTEDEHPLAMLSTDYSVQNVCLQMGLQAVSVDGFRIRSVKLWGKVCRACHNVTRNTVSVFCDKCGSTAMDRVPITLDKDGKMVIHDNRRKPRSLRGTVYSIPKFVGGKKSHSNLIMAPDEFLMGGRGRAIRHAQANAQRNAAKKDPFAERNSGLDNWDSRHMTATGKVIGANPQAFQAGYGRKNPNSNSFQKKNTKK